MKPVFELNEKQTTMLMQWLGEQLAKRKTHKVVPRYVFHVCPTYLGWIIDGIEDILTGDKLDLPI